MIKQMEVDHDIPSKKTQIFLVDYREFQVPVSRGKNPAGYELFPESPSLICLMFSTLENQLATPSAPDLSSGLLWHFPYNKPGTWSAHLLSLYSDMVKEKGAIK